jgi:stringent starvation protein B
MAEMSSNRPYLIRALYEWLVDNDKTPYLMVNVDCNGTEVPERYVDNGRIILNVDPAAVTDLVLGNDWIRFSARFGGVAEDIIIPPVAVMGIYAKENGQGMLFPEEEVVDSEPSDDDPSPPSSGGGRPTLKIVK